jgi:hypothetical protein
MEKITPRHCLKERFICRKPQWRSDQMSMLDYGLVFISNKGLLYGVYRYIKRPMVHHW